MSRLTALPTPTGDALTGEEVLGLVADLIGEHLPDIPFDDPFRASLAAMAVVGSSCKLATVREVK